MEDRSAHIGIAGFGLWGAHGNAQAWLRALESGRSAVTMHRFPGEPGAFAMPFAAAPALAPLSRELADGAPLGPAQQMVMAAAREALTEEASKQGSSLPMTLYVALQDSGDEAFVDVVAQLVSKRAALAGVRRGESSDVSQVGRLLRRAMGDLGSGRAQRALLGVSHRGVVPQSVGRLRSSSSLAATPARAMSFVHGHEGLAPADGCGFLVLEPGEAEPGSVQVGGIEIGSWSSGGREAALATLVSKEQAAVPDILFVSGTRSSRDDKDFLDAVKKAFAGLLVPIRSLDDIGGYGGGAGLVFGLSAAARALSSGILSKRVGARAGVVVLDADADAMAVTSLGRGLRIRGLEPS